jgi:Holliday junction resolvase RusA-like endonuclease
LCAVPFALPPTINSYYGIRVVESKKRRDRRGKPLKIALQYVTDEGEAYHKYMRERLLEKKAWHHSDQPLEVCMLVCPRDDRRQDISNRIKVLEDALKNGNLFKDDSQVETWEVRRGPKVKGGAVYMTVREIVPDHLGNLRWIRER